jgi:hypothetical protein
MYQSASIQSIQKLFWSIVRTLNIHSCYTISQSVPLIENTPDPDAPAPQAQIDHPNSPIRQITALERTSEQSNNTETHINSALNILPIEYAIEYREYQSIAVQTTLSVNENDVRVALVNASSDWHNTLTIISIIPDNQQ